MIQLKPGLQPTTLAKNRKSLSRQRKTARRKNRGLRFERVFSDAALSPFDEIEWEGRTAEITDDGGKVIFKQENIEVPKSWSAARDQDRRLEIFLRRHRARHRPVSGRARDFGAAARPSRDAHDHRLGHRGRLFRRRTKTPRFSTTNSPGSASISTARSTRPVWFNVGLYHQYGIGKDARRGQLFLQPHDRSKPSARRRNTNIRRAAPASSSRSTTHGRHHAACAMSEAMLFKYGSGTGSDLSVIPLARAKR